MRGLALAVLLISYPAIVFAQSYQGSELPQSLSIDLDFSGSEHLLVRASQRHADYALSLWEKGSQTPIKQLSFLSDKGLDELMLVSRGECKRCVVLLDGIAPIDRAGPYSLTVESVQDDVHDTSSFANRLAALKSITAAAENHFLADTQGTDLRQQYLGKAYEALASAVELASNSPNAVDDELNLYALTFLAETQDFLGQADDAKATLERLIALTDNQNSIYRALAYYEISAYEKNTGVMVANYDKGIKIAGALSDWRLEARGKNYKAIRLVRDGNINDALKLLSDAYSIYNESQSWRDLVEPLHNLSWANQQAGNIPASLAYATQLKLLAEEKKDVENALWALLDLGRSYGQMGDRFVASQFIDEALELLQGNQDRENTSWVSLHAYLLQEKALALLQYGEFELAATYARQSREAFQKRKHPNRIADAVFIEGEIELARGNISAAQEKFEASLAYDRENARRPFEIKCLLRIAELNIAQKKFNQAGRYNAQALALLTANDELKLSPRVMIQKLELYLLKGENQKAIALIKQQGSAIEGLGRDRDKAHFAFLQASASYATGDYLAALSHLVKARNIIDQQLPRVRQHDLRRNYLALQKSIFELNIRSLMHGPSRRTDEALRVAEDFKARTLEEKLIILRSGENLSPEHARQRKIIVRKIQENAVTWYSKQSQDEQRVLSDTRSLSHALEKLEAEILNFRSSPRQTDLPALIKPKANELIVYYFTGESESWLWAISSEKSEVYQLPPEETIERLAGNVLKTFSIPPAARKGGVWEQNKNLTAIADAIIAPLRNQLMAEGIRQLTIVPDGPLHGFPFSALTLDGSENPLIANYSIAYAPSLTALGSLRSRAKNQQQRLSHDALVVVDSAEENEFNSGLPQLPYSEDEARVIKSFLGESATVLGVHGARKQRLLKQLKEPYSILHFATHGLLNDKEPSLSGLVLSGAKSADSLWLTPEITGSGINTTLVVLSACESSIGKHIAGEGLLSLSRAFIEAGASDVIGTLWRVQDHTSSILITEFYKFLFDDGLSITNALQKAQASVYSNNNNDWADPYYWAGYQLQGGGESLFYGPTKKI